MEVQTSSSSSSVQSPQPVHAADPRAQHTGEEAAPSLSPQGATPSPTASPQPLPDPVAAGVNLAVKHPLQHRWTMWYDCAGKKISQSAWGDQLRKIVTIDTVEDFWGLYNNIQPASKLALSANYHLFKEGIEPKWEHDENKGGGKWILAIAAKNRKEVLDKYWLWMLLACIGEAFDDDQEVCGCVVSVRKQQDKIALWTKHSTNEGVCKRIGRQLKAALEVPDTAVLGYQSHIDCQKRNSSFNNKNRFEV